MDRLLAATLAATALSCAFSGCADEPDRVGFGGAPPQPAPSDAGSSSPVAPPPPGAAAPPPGGVAVPAEQVDARRLPWGYPRVVWTEHGGTVLGAYGQGGGCTEVGGEVAEQGSAVRLVLVEVTRKSGPCTMELQYPPVTVPLDAPLGERSVVLDRRRVGPPPGR